MSLLFLVTAFVSVIMLSTSVLLPGPISVKGQLNGMDNNKPPKMGVKITFPKPNQTVPTGPLTVYGISSNPAVSNCQVYVDWNDTKPMQNVTGIGNRGPNDYSNWTFTYTQKYHVITEGTNELTSKIACHDSSGAGNITTKYYSINVTGTSTMNPAALSVPTSSANASTGNYTTGFQNVGYHPIVPQFSGASKNNLSSAESSIQNITQTQTYGATINESPSGREDNSDTSPSWLSSSGQDSSDHDNDINSVSHSAEDGHDKKSTKAKDTSDNIQSNDNKKDNEKVKTHNIKHDKSLTIKKVKDGSHKIKFKLNNGDHDSGGLNKYIHNLIKERLNKISQRLLD
jgi:hypothetical protein